MKIKHKFRKFLVGGVAIILFLAAFFTLTKNVHAVNTASVPKNIKYETVVTGLADPLFLTHAGDGSGRLFIVQRGGQILIYKNGQLNGTPFLDISGIINSSGGEQGLLGLAFDPNYEASGRFFVVYTITANNAIRLARFNVSSDPDIAETNGTTILTINKTNSFTNHNGGMIAFGPYGYLYMSVGDSGGGGDPEGNGQDKNTLFGKILRLDVSGATYSIPPTNPFVGQTNVREEIWAYGLRNPWRLSFDRSNGDLYIGDVGQGDQEEVDFQDSSSAGGENYGWNILEGNLCYNASSCSPPPGYVPPVAVYNHGSNDSIGCSVTGGYVYRGTNFPSLVGVYLYGDFCKGKIWGMTKNESDEWVSTLIADTDYYISSFGEDENKEIYLTDYAEGKVLHLVEAATIQKSFLSAGTYDGYVLESSETSGTGSKMDTNGSSLPLGDNASNRQYRAILSFNTGALPDNAVIISAVVKIKQGQTVGINPFDTHGVLLGDIKTGSFNGNQNLETADFSASATKNSVLRFTNNPVNNWFTRSLNASNLIYINKTGVTQFRLRFTLDDNNDLGVDFLRIFSGNAASANRPKLIIQYFLP